MGIKDFFIKFRHKTTDLFAEKKASEVHISLIPGKDGTWSACAVSEKSEDPGFFLVNEGEYPVNVFFLRYDINGSSCMELDTCYNRNALLESLNWIGKSSNHLVSVWDFNENIPLSSELISIFEAAAERKWQILQEDADEFLKAASDEVCKIPLSQQIESIVQGNAKSESHFYSKENQR